MRVERRDGEHLLVLGADHLPAALVDHPVVAVAEQRQVLRVGVVVDAYRSAMT
jgi:hypothetical protein